MNRQAAWIAATLLCVACGQTYTIQPQDGGRTDGAAGIDAAPPDAAPPVDGAPGADSDVQHDSSPPDSGPSEDAVTGCTPADTRPCDCGGVMIGLETCLGNRTWSPCECPCTVTGHDEDSDGVDDGCDNCPTWPNPGQGNGDGDNLGDLCELIGNVSALSEITYFEPWTDSAALSGWTLSGGYVWASDQLNGVTTGGPEQATWSSALAVFFAVEASFKYASSPQGITGIRLIHSATPDTGYGCVLFHPGGQDDADLVLYKYIGAGAYLELGITEDVEPSSTPAGTPRRLRMWHDGSDWQCRYTNAQGAAATVTQASPDPTGTLPDRGGYYLQSGSAQFLSFVVYR